jgi:nucleoside-diphosphate-sugar epimerase
VTKRPDKLALRIDSKTSDFFQPKNRGAFGSGKAGRACITELLAHSYEVASVVRPPDMPVPFSRVELTDFGQTIQTFSQIDDRIRNVTAIVHLAAIPEKSAVKLRDFKIACS